MYKHFATSLLCLSILSGCEMNNVQQGAAIGAATGAIIGKSTGNHKDKRLVIGAALGALTGAAVGQYMDKQEAEFKEKLAGSGVKLIREGETMRLILPASITFASGQAVISPTFHRSLIAIADIMTEYEKTMLTVIGHTDSTGNALNNQYLSEHRATSVKQFLLTQHIQTQRIETQGMAASKPIASNQTEVGRAANRRVEIVITPITV